jgi:hypothetical protein
VAAVGTGWAWKRPEPILAGKAPRQFSISTVLFTTFLVALLLGTALSSPAGLYSLTMVGAFYVMVSAIVWGKPPRWQTARPLVIAISYVLVNVLCLWRPLGLVAASTYGPLAILFIFIGPLLVFAATLATYKWRRERLPRLALCGQFVWLAGTSFANYHIFRAILVGMVFG